MKLSEAIRMNGMMKPQGFGVNSVASMDAPCVIGGALQSVGKQIAHDTISNYIVLSSLWPWADDYFKCPACNSKYEASASVVLFHLNDYHEWTRQQIADWVASVEPQEEQSAQVEHELSEAAR